MGNKKNSNNPEKKSSLGTPPLEQDLHAKHNIPSNMEIREIELSPNYFAKIILPKPDSDHQKSKKSLKKEARDLRAKHNIRDNMEIREMELSPNYWAKVILPKPQKDNKRNPSR